MNRKDMEALLDEVPGAGEAIPPYADEWIGQAYIALRDAFPVIEAALAANPVTSIAVALGDTLNPWKETP